MPQIMENLLCFYFSPYMHATCPVHVTVLALIIQLQLCDQREEILIFNNEMNAGFQYLNLWDKKQKLRNVKK
jgi:hypothetical protein